MGTMDDLLGDNTTIIVAVALLALLVLILGLSKVFKGKEGGTIVTRESDEEREEYDYADDYEQEDQDGYKAMDEYDG